jgi:hypothetical protein
VIAPEGFPREAVLVAREGVTQEPRKDAAVAMKTLPGNVKTIWP